MTTPTTRAFHYAAQHSRAGAVGGWIDALVSVLPKIVDNLGKIDDALIRGFDKLMGTTPAGSIPPQSVSEIEAFIERARALIESLRQQANEAGERVLEQRREEREMLIEHSRERAALMSLFEPLGLVTPRQYNSAHGYQDYQWSAAVVGPVVSELNPNGANPYEVTPAVRAAVQALASRLGGPASAASLATASSAADDEGGGVLGHILSAGVGFLAGRASKGSR